MASLSSSHSLQTLENVYKTLATKLTTGCKQYRHSQTYSNGLEIVESVELFVNGLFRNNLWKSEFVRRTELARLPRYIKKNAKRKGIVQKEAHVVHPIEHDIKTFTADGCQMLLSLYLATQPKPSASSVANREVIKNGKIGGGWLAPMRAAAESIVDWARENTVQTSKLETSPGSRTPSSKPAMPSASELSNTESEETKGQVDKIVDKNKMSTRKKRGLTPAARGCIRLYHKGKKADQKYTMNDAISDYIDDNPEAKRSSIRRSLSDNPDAWKVDKPV
jgi:hypothetical protein